MPELQSWQAMRDRSAKILEDRTGTGVDEWNRRIKDADVVLPDAQALRVWLADQGVTGYAQSLLVMERFGYPDFLLASADALVDGQYVDRPHLRPVLDRILAVSATLGATTIQARQGYVSPMTPRRKSGAANPNATTMKARVKNTALAAFPVRRENGPSTILRTCSQDHGRLWEQPMLAAVSGLRAEMGREALGL